MKTLEERLTKLAKPAYAVELTRGEPDSIIASKFGGTPYFEHGESWPICSGCDRPEYYICQLDLSKAKDTGIPDHYGLVGFFYCWACFPYEPNKPGWTLTNHKEPSANRAVKIEMPPLPEEGFLSKLMRQETKPATACSAEFRRFESYPQFEELELLVSDEEMRILESDDDIGDKYYDLIADLSGRSDDYGTIIGGYAEWIQSIPYMNCERCGQILKQLLQIGSESQAKIMFGDAGAVYLLYCSCAPENLQLYSQCF